METILKDKEINTKNTNFVNKSPIKISMSLSIDKWFKGSRSRGIR